MSAVISARGLTKRYGNAASRVDNISFDIPAGRIVGLIGPNGSGKTTTLKAALGLIPFEGELKVLGLRSAHPARRADGATSASSPTSPCCRAGCEVSEAIDFVAGVHPRFDRAKAERYIAHTKLKPAMKVKEMSKGMIVQLHLALVMAIDAKLLVLDEPTLGLDILYRKQFYQNLLEDYFDEKKTIIVTTHQVEEIEHILTDLMFIRDGKIVLAATDGRGRRALHRSDGRRPTTPTPPSALKPIDERHGVRQVGDAVRRRAARTQLAALGETRNPGLADLFVATMKGTYA